MEAMVEIYKETAEADLRLFLFPAAEVRKHTPEPHACIIFFHGGGWQDGAPEQFFPQCAYLAERGITAISAEYRVETRHGTTPFDAVADAKSAIRYVRANAERFGIDPNRIAAGGGSAGGQMAAGTAFVDGFDDPAEDLPVSARPNALVLFNPVLDNGPEGYGFERVSARWREFSPLHNVRAPAPPAIVFLGEKDELVPVRTLLEFQSRMREAGARCDLWLYPEQGHSFFNDAKGRNPYFNATLLEADRFLVSIGFLTGEPTLPAEPVAAEFRSNAMEEVREPDRGGDEACDNALGSGANVLSRE